MMQSESIADLAAALAAAQGEIVNPTADKENPGFKGSHYADLAGILDAVRKPLSKQGLSVVQTIAGSYGEPTLRTTLLHRSGQWIAGEVPLKGELTKPQALGSLLTYMRRYSLAAIAGVAQQDDDGNAAQEQAQRRDDRRQERRPAPPSQPQPQPRPAPQANGNGHAPAAPPRQAGPKSECRAWFEAIVADANHQWSAILSEAGKSKAYKDIANVFAVCNHMVNDWIAGGMMEAEAVQTDGKRDNAKVWAIVKAAWTDDRAATEGEAKDYLHGELVKAAAAAGINLDSEPSETPAHAS